MLRPHNLHRLLAKNFECDFPIQTPAENQVPDPWLPELIHSRYPSCSLGCRSSWNHRFYFWNPPKVERGYCWIYNLVYNPIYVHQKFTWFLRHAYKIWIVFGHILYFEDRRKMETGPGSLSNQGRGLFRNVSEHMEASKHDQSHFSSCVFLYMYLWILSCQTIIS